MTEVKEKINGEEKVAITPAVNQTAVVSPSPARAEEKRRARRPYRHRRRRGPREERGRSEFAQKLLNVRRVTRVSAGGKRFNFSAALVLGDRNGSVGVGLGKGADTALAIEKAIKSAKKLMIHIPLTKEGSIPHEVLAKYSSTIVFLKSSPGRGLVAGSALRDVLDLGGVKNVMGKILSRSKNKLNIARAAIKALSMLTAARAKAESAPDTSNA